MTLCIGRLTSDSIGKGRVPFFSNDGTVSNKYYYFPLQCKNTPLSNSDICGSCSDKLKRIDSCTISKSGRLNGANHPMVLHGKFGEPIPVWSHIQDGTWFKSMVMKGYKIETMPKKEYDEAKIYAAIPSLKGLKNKMVEDLMKQFPELSKHAASNFITLYNKNKTNTVVTNTVVEMLVAVRRICGRVAPKLGDESRSDSPTLRHGRAVIVALI